MSEDKPSNVTMQIFDRVPYRFWVLVTVALCAGLISLLAMRSYDYIQSQAPKTDYPRYETLLKTSPDQQAFYKKMTGAWYLSKESAEMVIEFYEDGHFFWQLIDGADKYTKLFAAGRYAQMQNGQVLFSQMKELGLPFDRYNPGVNIIHFALDETAFSITTKATKRGENRLIFPIPEADDTDVNPAMVRLFKNLSDDGNHVSLRYIGKPMMRTKER